MPLLALLSIGGWPAAFPHFRIALTLDAALPLAVGQGAVAEAAAVWAPYGIAVSRLDPSAVACDARGGPLGATLAVRVAEPSPDGARAWSSPFGSIRFVAERQPDATILVHYDTVLKQGLSTVSLGGRRAPQWPGAVRDQVLGRMVGRVVAHEIGHWLLRSRDHSASGLMRASQSTDELAYPGRNGFALAATDVIKLRAVLTESRPACHS